MGVVKQVVELMVADHAHRPIKGEVCCFGRQTISVEQSEIKRIFKKNDVEQNSADAELDKETRHRNGNISDETFFNYFGGGNLNIIDISDYEGANIIANLNEPVADELQNKFDFIYTGGCHDNVFNPAQLLINSSKMLRSGGRVMHYESFGGLIGAYTYLTPEWFYSFYAVNEYDDCKVYICHQTEGSESRFDYKTDIYKYSPYFKRKLGFDYFSSAFSARGILYVMVVAEKGRASSDDKIPIQMQYLDELQTDWRRRSEVFNSSSRPLLKCSGAQSNREIFGTDHYKYMGMI